MISRRRFLKGGGAVVAGAAIGSGLLHPALTGVAAAADLDPATIPKFALKMPIPPVAKPWAENTMARWFSLTMEETAVEVIPGKLTKVRTFDKSFPGPTIRAKRGQRVEIQQTNKLTVPTSVHLHGGHVSEGNDGGPMDTLAPGGGSKIYQYPNGQPHASLWYHDHAHHYESENVYRGLTGTYLLTDPLENVLGLPSGAYDVPISLRDARFDENGQFVYQVEDFLNRNVILANGKAWPYFEVAARKYRLRLFNTANMRFFDLSLSDGSQFDLIGSDGGLLEAPYKTSSIAISPGERVDIVVDFSKYAVGTQLELRNAPTAAPGGPGDLITKVLQFRVNRTEADDSKVPAKLRTLPELPPATVHRNIELSMDETGSPDDKAYINGKVYDHDRIDTEVAYGSTEIWTVTNTNQIAPHNFHIHLVQFRVIERGGRPVTSGPESGLKDTVALMPGESVKVQMTFDGFRGKYLYHCHIFDHAAAGMMANLRVV
ncbi:multicopper oxidase family protein [Streptomyces sp. NBC_01304]|uniref:multicopper oxidase family protein n=1 Tax=Streptomyces sp. NBC_01304 TaxID=2903818 RepID=UPI002E0FDA19|nr:multicopper oxidase domain-containing protein [Streptomyces sp. NBC_01304]